MNRNEPLPVDLALQGGGSHGAFTWGVLERLLDDPTLLIDSVSGTSAGAMNAVVLADGFARGGADGAKQALHDFWRSVSDAARFSPLQRTPLDVARGTWSLDNSPGYVFFDLFSRLFSPYEVNPTNINPLRGILEEHVDFDRLRSCPIKVFINATNVRTGLSRVFRNADITPDAVLASACLPLMHQAVEIDGDPYWDGGFSGNPLLTPMIRETDSRDIIIIQINPIERPGVPRTAREITNRLNEISFNASLKKELRGIAILQRLLAETDDEIDVSWAERWSGVRFHRIATPLIGKLSASSKLNAEWSFLEMMRTEGVSTTDSFLSEHTDDLGIRSTYQIDTLDTLVEQV